ncbi:hypothetical protein E2562_027292 [Oryza meyeriana var. granulata]|uniref:Uncharacterized protein n=1 Tax=Oryza meyeriana var. granulata TaxID=110450 RepID=A0A6G1C9S6_9ORYZ|nr:hypothetical protein E2562_027292 [Oryza meyeriana var. granulata]
MMLGGKGAAIYTLSLGLADPVIDPSALQRLSTCAPAPQETPVPLRDLALAPPESRAPRLVGSFDLAAALPPASSDEAAIPAASVPVAIVLTAAIDCCTSSLVCVIDTVTALSCEATRGDIASFEVLRGIGRRRAG